MKSAALFASRRSHEQSGVAAIALAVVLVTFCGVLLLGNMVDREREAGSAAQQQQETARWAEEAIRTFVAIYGRAPCPALKWEYGEDCSGFSKGWLPVLTLEEASPSGKRFSKRAPTFYMVYNGGGATRSDPALMMPLSMMPGGSMRPEGFTPALVDGSAVPGYPDVRSSMDVCGYLGALSGLAGTAVSASGALPGGGRTDRAYIVEDGVLKNVAYAFAVTLPGNPRPADDLNGSLAASVMESPLRPADAGYTDIVRAVYPETLSRRLFCDVVGNSLTSLASAQAWAADAESLKAGNMQGARDIEKMGAPIAASDFVLLLGELANDINSKFNFGDNLGKALAAVQTPPLFLNYVTGAITALKGGILTVADLVKSITNTALDTRFVVEYVQAGKAAEQIPVWTDGLPILQKADEFGLADKTAR